jgi:hypothetical protein
MMLLQLFAYMGDTLFYDHELACSRDRLGAIAGGEQAVVTDAMEALGQHVMRNRRMNSRTSSVIVVYRPGPRSCSS